MLDAIQSAALNSEQLQFLTASIVDSGYVDAELLATSHATFGIDLIGPARRDKSWQAKTEGAFDFTAFRVDWDGQVVTCPNGAQTSSWVERPGPYGTPQYPTLSGEFVWDGINRWIKSHRRDDSRLNDRTSSRKPIFTTLHARRPCAFFGQSNVIPTSTHHV